MMVWPTMARLTMVLVDDGMTDDGTTDDGMADDGTTDDGMADDGTTDDGMADDGTGWLTTIRLMTVCLQTTEMVPTDGKPKSEG